MPENIFFCVKVEANFPKIWTSGRRSGEWTGVNRPVPNINFTLGTSSSSVLQRKGEVEEMNLRHWETHFLHILSSFHLSLQFLFPLPSLSFPLLPLPLRVCLHFFGFFSPHMSEMTFRVSDFLP